MFPLDKILGFLNGSGNSKFFVYSLINLNYITFNYSNYEL